MSNNNGQWEAIADDYDEMNGDDGNAFHRNLIRPATLRLLNPQSGDRILDACCGNGVFTRYLANLGANVTAFDFSPKMIDYANTRCAGFSGHVSLSVADATEYNQLMKLGGSSPFDKAVANMAVMGLPEIEPLFKAVYDMLKTNGVFVFSATHPCFQTPDKSFTADGSGLITTTYIRSQRYAYQILSKSEKCAYHWHRPLQNLLGVCFSVGFVMDGLEEPIYAFGESTHSVWAEVPLPIIVRVRKITL
ncbi:MAG: class I SAM-dependent methyltransferase [Synergistaceae bacterium]|jgi:ubiquinone/menaquinone biosynthesis C-methylase UbiE|nr:class I SAM-dependent methyltransferase [Synergistaceae bacterium]